MTGRPKWEPDLSDLSDTIYDFNGNVAAVSRKFDISRQTAYKYIRENPEIQKIVNEAREYAEDNDLDLAESMNRYYLRSHEDYPSLCSIHVRYTLDKKGKKRGWGNNENNSPPNEDTIKNTFNQIDAEYKIILLEKKINELQRKTNCQHEGSE
jgi:hypothetical protein